MTVKVSEEVLKQLAVDVDKHFAELVVAHKDVMSPLDVSAVLLSRLILMHRSLGTENDFKRLGTIALNIQEPVIPKEPSDELPTVQ